VRCTDGAGGANGPSWRSTARRCRRPSSRASCSVTPRVRSPTQRPPRRAVRPGEGGTVFLDEIGELALGLQPKLLRALQERVVRPVGSDTEVAFDARLVAATNRDIEAAVESTDSARPLLPHQRGPAGAAAAPVPGQRYPGDCPALRRALRAQFAKEVTGITAAAAERLLSYSWPGNVRELQNCIERAVALARRQEILVEDLPERIQSYRKAHVLLSPMARRSFCPSRTSSGATSSMPSRRSVTTRPSRPRCWGSTARRSTASSSSTRDPERPRTDHRAERRSGEHVPRRSGQRQKISPRMWQSPPLLSCSRQPICALVPPVRPAIPPRPLLARLCPTRHSPSETTEDIWKICMRFPAPWPASPKRRCRTPGCSPRPRRGASSGRGR